MYSQDMHVYVTVPVEGGSCTFHLQIGISRHCDVPSLMAINLCSFCRGSSSLLPEHRFLSGVCRDAVKSSMDLIRWQRPGVCDSMHENAKRADRCVAAESPMASALYCSVIISSHTICSPGTVFAHRILLPPLWLC